MNKQIDLAYKVLNEKLSQISTTPEHRRFIRDSLEIAFSENNLIPLRHALYLDKYPTEVEEFLFGKKYLARPRNELYPVVVDTLIDVNENYGRVLNTLTEFVGTGGIGVAKTTIALFINLYQIYLLSCYRNPHAVFNLDTASEISFIFQSLNGDVAKTVDYDRLRKYCEQSPYFTQDFKFDKYLKSKLSFPKRIVATPMTSDNSSIGQNVIGGLIDEVNFMAVVQSSAKTRDNGVYDQAKVIYDSISRRIKSRFINEGGGAGVLCLVASKHYPNEFTDQKIEEAETDPTIYVYDKRVWEVKPAELYSKTKFPVFVGTPQDPAKIITPAEIGNYSPHSIIEIPDNLKRFFEKDLLGALRDMAGVTQVYKNSYITNYHAITKAFSGVSLLTKQTHSFTDDETPLQVRMDILKNTPKEGRKFQRWVHIDLSKTGDATGIACGFIERFEPVVAEDGTFLDEVMPVIKLDFVLQVTAPPNGEIKFYKIRDLLYKLRDLGLPIKWVTFDQFQSTDSIQILRQKKFSTGTLSVDIDTVAYSLTKNAMYENRLIGTEHEVVVEEFKFVEEVKTSNGKIKIDHTKTGSKDCSDAVAGVVKGLSTRKDLWFAHGVNPSNFSKQMALLQAKAQSNVKEES